MRSSLFLALLLGVFGLARYPQLQQIEVPQAFVDAGAQKIFAEGVELFQQQKWLDADKRFKDCLSLKVDGDTALVSRYRDACAGGKDCDEIRKQIEKKKWRKALQKLDRLAKSHEATPLKPILAELRREIAAALYFPLADFEENPPAPEAQITNRKGSVSFNTDTRYVTEGLRSLKWDCPSADNRIDHVDLGSFDFTTVEEYPLLHLSLYNTSPNYGKLMLILHVDSVEGIMDEGGDLRKPCLSRNVTLDKTGWMHLDINVQKEFGKFGTVTINDMKGLLILAPPGKSRTIYIDAVRLEKAQSE